MSSFEDLGIEEEVCKGCSSIGWKNPSKLQKKVIKKLSKAQMVGKVSFSRSKKFKLKIKATKQGFAFPRRSWKYPWGGLFEVPHNSGRVGAFAIPVLDALKKSQASGDDHQYFACVLCTSSKRANVILNTFQELSSYFKSTGEVRSSMFCIGASRKNPKLHISSNHQKMALQNFPPHIVVGTCDRLSGLALEVDGFLDSLKRLKYLVIDDADDVLENVQSCSFVSNLMTSLRAENDPKILLFGSRMTPNIRLFMSVYLSSGSPNREQKIFHVKMDKPPKRLNHTYYTYKHTESKTERLVSIICNMSKDSRVLVYTCDDKTTSMLRTNLQEHNILVTALTHNMNQAIKHDHLKEFKEGRTGVLVSTDFETYTFNNLIVDLVINFEFPHVKDRDGCEVCKIRFTRTAQAGSEGTIISFVPNPLKKRVIKKFFSKYDAHEAESLDK